MDRKQDVKKYINDLRKAADRALNGQDLKSIKTFTATAGTSLSFMRFEHMLHRAGSKRKKSSAK